MLIKLPFTLPTINPIAISFGNISIHWYGIIIALAILLGMIWINLEGKKHGFNNNFFTDLLIYVIPVAIICARLYYVMFNLDYYLPNKLEIIKIWHGGIAIHGALIGGVLTTIIFAKVRAVSFWRLVDIMAPALLFGQALGRWGNFVNQEAYGTEVARSFLENLHIPNFIIENMFINGTYHHPTFLYESIWNILGVILIILYRRRNPILGTTFFLYIVWYSFGRFFIEGLRTDSLLLFSSVRIAQLLSLALFFIGIIAIWWRKKTTTKRYFK